jgi:hypothetical protein
MRVIKKYSYAQLPMNKKPKVFRRSKAVESIKSEEAGGAEWTAPTTPIVLLYQDARQVPREDAVIVGTIGDLHDWVRRDVADFDFLVRIILLGGLSIFVGAFLAMSE